MNCAAAFALGLYAGGVVLGLVFGLAVSEDEPDRFNEPDELAALSLVTVFWPWLVVLVVGDALVSAWRSR